MQQLPPPTTPTPIVEWITAIATLLAVIVALFKEDIVTLWKRPAIDSAHRTSSPRLRQAVDSRECGASNRFQRTKRRRGGAVVCYRGVVNTAPLWVGDMYFFRMWIENTGQQRADRVQVFVARLLHKHQDGVFRNVGHFLPMNLHWAHPPANTTQIFADINPCMGKHCDLGAISDPANNTLAALPGLDAGDVSFDLALEVLPSSQSHRLIPGCYRLELRIGGANVAPISKTVEINFSGRWYPQVAEMFANGIGIKET